MINLAVVSLKDIIKFLKICFMFLFIILLLKLVVKISDNKNWLTRIDFKAEKIINQEFILAENNIKKDTHNNSNLFKKIITDEFAILSELEKELMEKESVEEIAIVEEIIEKPKEELPQYALNNVITKVVSEKNKKDTYTHTYNSIRIKNESKYNLTQEMLVPDFELTNKNNITIFHTHTCESYTPTEKNNYISTGNYRTTDLSFTVAKVGEELANNLKGYGFSVNHNKTYHDYPAYNGSYTRSLNTINNSLSTFSSEIIIDVHRDALGNNSSYGPCVQIGEERVAQIMFVIGTDGGGLNHPDWINNLKVAIKIQEKANEMYPGLFKPIILRNSRYNQHVSNGACIIEVGATGNTLEECTGSMKYLASIINEVIK